MGHYQFIQFEAQLTEKGAEILKAFYDEYSANPWSANLSWNCWKKTAELFSEYPFVEWMIKSRQLDVLTVSAGLNLPGYRFDFDKRLWTINCEFKWAGFSEKTFCENFLPFVIAEPAVVKIDHDLWENPHTVLVEPKPLPKPDWYRKVGEQYDP